MMFEQNRNWIPTWSYEGWAAAQSQDDSLADMIKLAQSPHQNIYAQKDGILYKLEDGRYCSVVPTIFRKRLMKQFHDLPARGHQGPDRTYQAMKYYFFWPNMRLEIFNFIERCFLCQKHKRNYLRVPLQHHVIPREPFHTVSVDLVGPVVRSENGEEYILVMQDMLTRWVELAALKHTNSEAIMEKFRVQWIMRYGPPERLLSDRGSNFISQFALEYCKFYGIDKIHTTAYRPQGNGANERMHSELARFFRIYLDDQSKSRWNYLLEYAAYAYNTSYHTGLRTTPYEALFGRLPPLGPLSVPLDPKDPVNEANFHRFIGMRRRELFQKRKLIQEALLKAQDRQLDRRNRFAHNVPFKIGDYVFYKNHNPRTKWDAKFTGPWKIIDQISHVVFELDLDGKRFTAHAAHLKPYKPPITEENELQLEKQPGATGRDQESPAEDESNDYEQVFIPPAAVQYRRPQYEPSYDLDSRLGRSFRNLFRLPGSPRSPDQDDTYTPPRGVRHALKKIFRAPSRLTERAPLADRPRHRELYDAGASPMSDYLRRSDRSRGPPDRYTDSKYSRK
jgi:transposase InsO family protein